jgi:hypothetical protein
VSIYRRSATQPLGLRWGFETTSSQIMDYCQRLIAIQGLTPVRLKKMAASGMTGNRHLSIEEPGN